MIPVPGFEACQARYLLLPLDRPAEERAELLGLLTEGELKRGQKLLDPLKRERFMVGRALLRQILAGERGVEPRRIELSEGEFGKPYLPSQQGADAIHFNVSHAGGKLLFAVCRSAEVGVDLEEVRQDLAFRPMAERYFSERERAELFGLEPQQQLAAFYRCWTRKEAYMKATGSGFSQPSTGFDVSLRPGEPAALVGHRADPAEVGCWRIIDLSVPAGYQAALAVKLLPPA